MSIAKNKKFLIFDLDGTLINSIPDLTRALNIALTQFSYRELSIEEVTTMVGNGARLLVERGIRKAKKEEPTTDEVDKVLNAYFIAYKNNVCIDTFLYPNVEETLSFLHQKGFEMVICTNKPYDLIEPILEDLKVKKYFKDWVGENSLNSKKPDAEPLNYLMEKHNHTKEESMMIGDSKNDILAAYNAGIDSIGLTYGYNYNESVEVYNPTYVVDDFTKLKDILQDTFQENNDGNT